MTVKQEVPTFDTYIQQQLELAEFPRDKSLKSKRYKNETPEQREKRLKWKSEYQKKKKENETPEQREKRLKWKSEYEKRKRKNETPEQREIRLENRRKKKKSNSFKSIKI